jgi:hypothetical protein
VLALVNSLTTMVSEINRLEAEIADALAAHPDGPVFRSFFALATPIATRSPPRPAARRSLTNQANAKARSFAGRATTAYATRCRRWLTRSDAGTHGPPTSMRLPAPAGITTAAPYGPSVAAWPGSSGSAGPPTPPMTPNDTPRCNDTSPPPSPTRRAPGPTSPPPNA